MLSTDSGVEPLARAGRLSKSPPPPGGGAEKVKAAAEKLYTELKAAGIDVLFHDGNERPGVMFADLELIAARTGRGAWAKTDWEKLPKIRKEAREETAELESAKGTREAVEGSPVDINHASRDELMTLPGIGEKTALGIIEARPYQSLDDLKRATGIGPSTFEKIKAYLSVTAP